jgi:hypothetical protein
MNPHDVSANVMFRQANKAAVNKMLLVVRGFNKHGQLLFSA